MSALRLRRFPRSLLPAFALACGAFFILASPALAQALGQQETFRVDKSFDYDNRQSVTAKLRAVGTRSLVYVEDVYYDSLSGADRALLLSATDVVRNEFDGKIYSTVTDFFGKPAEPGVDGDPRITILLMRMKQGVGGYLNTADSFMKEKAPESNEREILYINATFYPNPRRMYGFIAHELTHLIDFNQKVLLRGVTEEAWLNELRAEYATAVAGYDKPYAGSIVAKRVVEFLETPDASLTEWLNEGKDYAAVSLFAQYLTGKYGADILKYSMLTERTGIAALEYGLDKIGAAVSFADVFQDWLVANLVNSAQPGLAYVYDDTSLTGAALRIPKATVTTYLGPTSSTSVSRKIEDWAGQWIEIFPTGLGYQTLAMTVSSNVPLRAKAVLKHANGAVTVQSFAPSGSSAWLSLGDISSYASVTVVPVLMGKREGFSTGESDGNYSQEVSRTSPVSAQRLPSGAPLIGAVSPPIVPPRGNVPVTVSGSGFLSGQVSLQIDGQAVSPVVLSDTEMRVVVPAHAEGDVCLTITVDTTTTGRCGILTYGTYPDGSLLRAEGDYRVWVVRGEWRRHIVASDVFSFYGHLGFDKVTTVPREMLEQIRISSWVRAPMTTNPTTWRIYEVNADGTKHWITCANPDNCGTTWRARGGDPAGIFTVNRIELDYYTEGPRVFIQ